MEMISKAYAEEEFDTAWKLTDALIKRNPDNEELVYLRHRIEGMLARCNYWDGDEVGGKVSIKISIAQRHAYFYKGGKLVGECRICAGNGEGVETPKGKFTITEKVRDWGSKTPSRYMVQLPRKYFMRMRGDVGLIDDGGASKEGDFGDSYSYRTLDGCVMLPGFFAEVLFKSAPIGTPVTISD
jgi:hypothetical protein